MSYQQPPTPLAPFYAAPNPQQQTFAGPPYGNAPPQQQHIAGPPYGNALAQQQQFAAPPNAAANLQQPLAHYGAAPPPLPQPPAAGNRALQVLKATLDWINIIGAILFGCVAALAYAIFGLKQGGEANEIAKKSNTIAEKTYNLTVYQTCLSISNSTRQKLDWNFCLNFTADHTLESLSRSISGAVRSSFDALNNCGKITAAVCTSALFNDITSDVCYSFLLWNLSIFVNNLGVSTSILLNLLYQAVHFKSLLEFRRFVQLAVITICLLEACLYSWSTIRISRRNSSST